MTRLILVMLLAAAMTTRADTLPEDDNGPLTGGFGMPGIDEGGLILESGKLRPGFSVITASHAIVEDEGNEQLILDGESIRATLDLRYGLRPGLEVGIEVPYVAHQSGSLDSLIDTWHDIFQLPEGSRDDRPQDLLEFNYQDGVENPLNFTSSARGIGDIRVFAGWDFRSTENHHRALRVSVKLPTGDADKLLGSGGTDVGIGIAGDLSNLGGNPKIGAFYRANITYLSEPDLLANRYEDFIGQLSGGLSYSLTDRYEFNVQSTLRTAAYDSDIEKLGEPSLTLTFGGNIRLTGPMVLSLAVTEDIKVNSAPDVSFNIGLRYRPR